MAARAEHARQRLGVEIPATPLNPDSNQLMNSPASSPPLVGILMGSDSDWPTMKAAAEVCAEFGVACDA